jgi:hypothetical protein
MAVLSNVRITIGTPSTALCPPAARGAPRLALQLAALFAVAGIAPNASAGVVFWNMQTDTPTSNNLAGVTVGALTQGNNNGTTTMLTASSTSTTYSFLLDGVTTANSGANNAGLAARVGALSTAANGSAYLQFTVTPTSGPLEITDLGFGSRSTGTGPQAWTLRSDADAYAANLVTPGSLTNNSTWAYRLTALTSPLTVPQNTTRTFRLYGYAGSGSASAGTANWRVDDLQVVPEPPAFVLVAAGLGTLTYLARGRRGGRRSTRQDPPAAG